jgi:glycerol uptake facilitator-like aquaporin
VDERPDLLRRAAAEGFGVFALAQLTGALVAAGLLAAVWPDQPAALGTTLPTVGIGSAFVYEVVLTAFLMFVIMAVAGAA